MLRITIVCFIGLALQVAALPEYIENLERDLSSLPEEYQHVAKELNLKRAVGNERDEAAYCCTNWQLINNDEVHTKVQSVQVPQSHTITVGYQDCHGNLNPVRPLIPAPATRPPHGGRTTTPRPGQSTTTGCMWTAVNKTETFLTTILETVTYLVPNSQKYCAPVDYKCCPKYVLLNNNCIHESSVASLEFLMQLGLIGGIGKK